MPSYSRSNSRTRYDAPASPEASDEDFVNTNVSPPVSSGRPASRSSNLSGASRSSRHPKVHESSSSESTDSEEERELEAELLDADLEVGVVRGAPVVSRAAQIMRSVGKGGSGGGRSSQRYSALDAAGQGGLGRSSSGRSHKSHKSSRSRRATAMYDLEKNDLEKNPADFAAEHTEFANAGDPDADPALMGPERPRKHKRKSKGKKTTVAGAVAVPTGGTPRRSNTKRIWCYVLLAIILIILVAVIVFVAVKATQNKNKNNTADASSTGSLASDVANSTAVSNMTSLSTANQPSASGNTTAFESGTGSAGSPTTTYNDGQYHPSTATSTGTGVGSAATLESSSSSANNGLYTFQTTATATESTQQMGDWDTLASTTGATSFASAASPSGAASGSGGGQSITLPGASQSGIDSGLLGASSDTNSLATGAATTTSSDTLSGASAFGLSMGLGPVVVSSTDGAATASPTASAGWGEQTTSGTNSLATGALTTTSSDTLTNAFGLTTSPGSVLVSSTDGAAGASPTASAGWGEQTTGAEGAQATSSASSPMGQGAPSWASSGLPTDSTSIGPYSKATVSQATARESFQTYRGDGTWFESSGHFGACGVAANNTDFVVALNDYIWLNSTAQSTTTQSPYCGAEVLLTNMQDGTSVNAWVTERCAYCVGDSSLDLSKAAFAALAGGDDFDLGTLSLVWGFTGNSSSSSASLSSAATTNQTASATATATNATASATSKSSSSGWF